MSRSHTRRRKQDRKRGMQARRTAEARALPNGSPVAGQWQEGRIDNRPMSR